MKVSLFGIRKQRNEEFRVKKKFNFADGGRERDEQYFWNHQGSEIPIDQPVS